MRPTLGNYRVAGGPDPGGGFLVSYIYLDGKGDFKGWFFEVRQGAAWQEGSPGPWGSITPP
jgi:hypothetical protein